MIRRIIIKYFNISLYYEKGRKNNCYISKYNEGMNYQYAVQSGICNLITGDSNKFNIIENLLYVLE